MELLPITVALSALSALAVAMLLAGPGVVGDKEDCASNPPAVSIPTCIRIIGQMRDPIDKIADGIANRGKAYLWQNHVDRAIADLDEALSRKPTPGDSHHNRGVPYLQKAQKERAFADFRKALDRDPSDEHVKKNLRKLGALP